MTTCLHKITQAQDDIQFATEAGTKMHAALARITLNGDATHGDQELISHIRKNPDLAEYFTPTSLTEVPIAGTISGRFISRRIDRMIINTELQQIKILDYKTDINKTDRREKYIFQLKEYAALMHAIYPSYSVSAAILWTHDWTLEKILN